MKKKTTPAEDLLNQQKQEWLREQGLSPNQTIKAVLGYFVPVSHNFIKLLPKIGPDAFALWVYLARYENHQTGNELEGWSWPSYRQIIAETGFTNNKISRAIKILEDNQLLKRVKEFSKPTKYKVLYDVFTENL